MSGVYLIGSETPPDAAWLIEALKKRLGDDWDGATFERGGYRHLYAECCRGERDLGDEDANQ